MSKNAKNTTKIFPEEQKDFHYIARALKNEIIDLSGKTILLAGGSGFLGTAFKKFLLFLNKNAPLFINNPCKVISVDNYIKGTITAFEEDIDEHLISLSHDIILPIEEKLKDRHIDYIINCSGNASPRQYERYPNETIDVSIFGVRNLLTLAKERQIKILNFSSSEVLGTPVEKEIPTTEESICSVGSMNLRAPYDVSKIMIETLSFLANKDGVKCKVIRPFNVIGYFNKGDFRVIPNYFNKLHNKQKIEVFRPGTQTRTFCFYSDFIVGCFKVLLNGKDLLYHIGNSNNEIQMLDLAVKVSDLYNRKDISLVPTPNVYQTEPKRRCPSIKKAQDELGYNPSVGLDEMLRKIKIWVDLTY